MQELVFTKMREASSARELNIPLRAEIDALRALLEEEEKRFVLLSYPFCALMSQATIFHSCWEASSERRGSNILLNSDRCVENFA